MDKFGEDTALWRDVGALFASLPLATVLPRAMNGGALVVHAGVGSGVVGDVTKGGESILHNEHVADLLWSDPDLVKPMYSLHI